tara:strand:+ start:105205 stop:106125 length:921 start_codon:yes stop_codon:yes gene_type:complete
MTFFFAFLLALATSLPSVSLNVELAEGDEVAFTSALQAALQLRGVDQSTDSDASSWQVQLRQTPLEDGSKNTSESDKTETMGVFQIVVFAPDGEEHARRTIISEIASSANRIRVFALVIVEMLGQPPKPQSIVPTKPPSPSSVRWLLTTELAQRFAPTRRFGLAAELRLQQGRWSTGGGLALHLAFNSAEALDDNADSFVPGNALGLFITGGRSLVHWSSGELWARGGVEGDIGETVRITGNNAVGVREALAVHLVAGLELHTKVGEWRPVLGLGWRQPLLAVQWLERSYNVAGSLTLSAGIELGR